MIGRLTTSKGQVAVLLRLRHRYRHRRWVRRLVTYRLARWGVHIHEDAQVGADTWLAHPVGIVIGWGAVVEDRAVLYQNVTLGSRKNGDDFPTIRTGAQVFAGAVVLGAVEIGEGAVVGANAVVTIDVPAGRTAVGAPARLV